MDRLAADFAAFSSGSSKIIWWRFATKLEAPKMESIHSNATEILRQIAEEIFLDKEEAAQQIMSVNGIIGAANGGFKMKQQGDLFTILKQRFAHRTKLEGIVAHPLFDSFLQKRTEEITARENGSPF